MRSQSVSASSSDFISGVLSINNSIDVSLLVFLRPVERPMVDVDADKLTEFITTEFSTALWELQPTNPRGGADRSTSANISITLAETFEGHAEAGSERSSVCTCGNTGTGGTVLVIGPPKPVPGQSTLTVIVEAAIAGPSLGANRGREPALPLVERDIGGDMASPRPG